MSIVLFACNNAHFLKEESYRNQVAQDFEQKKRAFPHGDLFAIFGDSALSVYEREALMFLYAYMPIGDVTDYPGDNGQTSAWYVFTALGFYPVCPGSNEYVMGAPYFKKATITLENGKKLEISAPKNNDDNRYIRSLNYNGKNYTKNYLNHFDLLKGGRLVFDMDNKPNKGRGINESDFPYSFSRDAK